MSTMVLLGAGASVPSNIPATFEMTEKVRAHVRALKVKNLAAAFDLVVGGLQMTNPQARLGQVDVEQVLTVSTLLANRTRTELAPFVAAWHPLVESVDVRIPHHQPAWKVAAAIGRLLNDYHRENGDYRDTRGPAIRLDGLERAIMDFATDITSGQNGNIFGLLSRHIYAALINLTWLAAEEAPRTRYLDPLVEAARASPLVVATLNYDNSVERCAEANAVKVSTGIQRWLDERQIEPAQEGVELLKLHGSANWTWDGDDAAMKVLGDDEIASLKSNVKDSAWSEVIGGSLAIVFGGDNKLTARGPFLDLLSRFKRALWDHRQLLIVGYSFRDDHINRIIKDWLTIRNEAEIVAIGSKADDGGSSWHARVRQHPVSSRLFSGVGRRCDYRPVGAEAGLKQFFE